MDVVELISDNDDDAVDDEDAETQPELGPDETACTVCNLNTSPDKILLCDGDGCNLEYHMYCLKPKLKEVPEGDFYGPCCRSKHVKRKSRK